jgi:GNAT superfamily N-acetyltransferase/catechol 2,3-dioxygenase-like lactoylglutathione lyase family enzyme
VPSYTFSDDPARVDVDAVWAFLSEHAYWGRWRTRADLERQLASAWRVVGCYDETGATVGFCRAVSDGVALAYLADVYVEPAHRGAGVGRGLVQAMIEDGPGARFRWMLHTADAHGLYRDFGFAPPDATYLERPAGGPAGAAGPAWLRMRTARPSRDLARARAFYVDLLGLAEDGGFTDHDGYDGLFVRLPGGGQLELTTGGPEPAPGTADDLLVLYLATEAEVTTIAERLADAGVHQVPAENPYWDRHGVTVLDPDGYRVTIARTA